VGARRIPDSAANADPIIQAVVRTLVGNSPDRLMSVGFSTTARIATPVLERRR
jgi:dienelactone hydrolase